MFTKAWDHCSNPWAIISFLELMTNPSNLAKVVDPRSYKLYQVVEQVAIADNKLSCCDFIGINLTRPVRISGIKIVTKGKALHKHWVTIDIVENNIEDLEQLLSFSSFN